MHPGAGGRLVGHPLDSRGEQDQYGDTDRSEEQRRRDDQGGSNVHAGSMDGDDALGEDGLLMDQYYGEGSHLEMDEQEMDLQVRRSHVPSNRTEQTDGMQERRAAAWFGGQAAQQEEDGQHRYSEQTLPSRSSGEKQVFANAGARDSTKGHEDLQGSSSPDRSEDARDGDPARSSGGQQNQRNTTQVQPQPGATGDLGHLHDLQEEEASDLSKGRQPTSNKYKQRGSAPRPHDQRNHTNTSEAPEPDSSGRHEAQDEQDNANLLAPLQLASENQHLRQQLAAQQEQLVKTEEKLEKKRRFIKEMQGLQQDLTMIKKSNTNRPE